MLNTFSNDGGALERNIRILLNELGIQVNLCGYEYLTSAIVTICEISHREMIQLVDYLYVTIANRYGTSVACVERSMRYAINSAWREYPDRFDELLHIKHKLTTGQFVMKIAHYVSYMN